MRRAGALLAGVLAVLVAASARAGPEATDDMGHRVALDGPAQRIVSLAPHATEDLFAIGAGARIVATVSHSDYPPAARDLPRVGKYNDFSVEAVLAQDPDLVVAWRSGNVPAQVRRIRRLGVPVYVNEPRSLEDIAGTLLRLGVLAGTEERARQAADAFRQRLAGLRARYSGRPPVRVFYQVWNDPLMTVNGEHVISDVIRSCGGRNVFADLGALAPRVSVEAVIERDPDAIVASGMGRGRPEWLDMWQRWPGMTAVARDHLYFIPPSLLQRHAPRILDGLERMCRHLEQARSDGGAGGG